MCICICIHTHTHTQFVKSTLLILKLLQLTEQSFLDKCAETQLCVISFLPHILDSGEFMCVVYKSTYPWKSCVQIVYVYSYSLRFIFIFYARLLGGCINFPFSLSCCDTCIIRHSMGLTVDVRLQRLSHYRGCRIIEAVRLQRLSDYRGCQIIQYFFIQ
jgi:hypothetical protein